MKLHTLALLLLTLGVQHGSSAEEALTDTGPAVLDRQTTIEARQLAEAAAVGEIQNRTDYDKVQQLREVRRSISLTLADRLQQQLLEGEKSFKPVGAPLIASTN